MEKIKQAIESGKTALGIEFGSTRIKAVLIDKNHEPLASGSYDWENSYDNGVWTYPLDEVWTGLRGAFAALKKNVLEKGITNAILIEIIILLTVIILAKFLTFI